LARFRKEASEKLTAHCKLLTEENRIDCDFQIATGDVNKEIRDIANAYHADMIVMGTEGATGIEKLVFGSNTSTVIEAAPCFVIAVPKNASLTLPKKIALATDYENMDVEDLKKLCGLCKVLKAELTVIHVSKESRKSDRDLIEDFSRMVANQTTCSQPYYYVVVNEDVAKGIESFIDSNETELMVLSTHRRNAFNKLWHPSLTKKLVHRTKLPLLSIPVEP
jgi:nucleotide-binding universal stress UspA family protein